MARQLPVVFSLGHRFQTGAAPCRTVPQEHTFAAGANSAPRDWSDLGRRVLAEAWRRFTEDAALDQALPARPVAPPFATAGGVEPRDATRSPGAGGTNA